MTNKTSAPRALPSAPRFWCKKLRWKSYSVDREDAGRAVALFVRGGQTFSCLSTQGCAGEDDGPVAPEQCHPGRPCYAEHPTLVMLKRAVA